MARIPDLVGYEDAGIERTDGRPDIAETQLKKSSVSGAQSLENSRAGTDETTGSGANDASSSSGRCQQAVAFLLLLARGAGLAGGLRREFSWPEGVSPNAQFRFGPGGTFVTSRNEVISTLASLGVDPVTSANLCGLLYSKSTDSWDSRR